VGDLGTLGAVAVYAVVIGFVFAECALLVGFFLPGDTLLFAAGLVAADDARGVSLPWLVTGVLIAAIGGECVGYLAGVRFGRAGLLRRRGGRVLTPANLARAERFAQRYGVLAIIAARWIPWVRTLAPLLAGVARMPWPRFLLGNVIGALCWGPALLVLGYLAAGAPALRHASLVVAAVVVGVSVVGGYLRWRHAAAAATQPGPARRPDPATQPDPVTQPQPAAQPGPAAAGLPPDGDR
jgi:membrane-associated protein